ncbi:MAG: hypothetical protein HQ592_18840, partial [Planctomycetes bacterium]|nr:hypothetical protein [Planctomycetota bacterium]
MKPKLAILTIIVLAAATNAATARSVFEQRVSINVEDVSVTHVLNILHRGLNLSFDCPPELVADARVTVHVEDLPVDEVLRRILRPNGLEFIYTGEN